MRKTLAIIITILIMLPFGVGACDLIIPTELDHEKAVKRIEDAKLHWLEKREPSEEDAPYFIIINDYREMINTHNPFINQRLIIVR